MPSLKTNRLLLLWSVIMGFLLLAVLTCWWFGRQIDAIDKKIETIEKK